jgi:hypothetical protein
LPDRSDLRGRLRRANPVRLAVFGVALSVGVFAGIQLGNSAIADINPVHYRGAVLHPRERGAAVPEQRVRPAEPRYAALYGWDEGRAALAAERDGFGELEASPPPIAAAPRRRAAAAQAWNQPAEPHRFRASVSDNEVRVHRYDYQSRDTYLPPSAGAEDRSEDKPEVRD